MTPTSRSPADPNVVRKDRDCAEGQGVLLDQPGLLALAIAFHLGALSAGGRAAAVVGGLVSVGSIARGNATVVDESGMIWAMTGAYGPADPEVVGPVAPPRAGRIAAIDGLATGGQAMLWVLYEDGETYQRTDESNWQWVRVGDLLSDPPAPATPTTWGWVKAERR